MAEERVAINREHLVMTAVTGEVTSPAMDSNPYEVTANGTPIVPVGAGGICYNVQVGMSAFGWVGDQVEPGVSIANAQEEANDALTIFACIGNRVQVRTGDAAGAWGIVTGKHEEFGAYKHLLVHVDRATLERLLPGDTLLVRAHGCGMRVPVLPGITCHSLSPDLWEAWDPRIHDGRLQVRVTAIVPAELMGSGSGRLSAAACLDLQSADTETLRRHGLDGLRLGDLVAVRDWDATYYTGYRQGALTVGVIAHGDSRRSGHGPGLTILLSCSDDSMAPILDAAANLATLLGL